MKKIAAAFISCIAAFAHADELSRWDNALSVEDSAYFDEMLRVESGVDALSPPYESLDRWLISSRPASSRSSSIDVGSRYSLSLIEVAYSGQHQGSVYGFAEKHVNEDLAVFLQVSQTSNHTVHGHEYIGTGITFNNRWRAGDGVGLGVAHARSDERQIYPDWESADMAWELSYFGHLLNRLDAQTSVYYIQYPAQEDAAVSDSIAAQVRVHFKF